MNDSEHSPAGEKLQKVLARMGLASRRDIEAWIGEGRVKVNGEVATAMEAAVDQLEADPDVWVGVLRANTEGQDRPVFSAGADLKAINSDGPPLMTTRGGFGGFAFRERRKPVIAAVDGLATAGGCELVLACDLVVATTRSSFGLAEVKRNLVAGAGGLFRLPRAIGRAAAMEAILRRFISGGGTVVFSSHVMDVVERLCDRVVIVSAGQVLREGTVEEVTGGRRLLDVFVDLVGARALDEGSLEWLGSSPG